MSLSLAFKIKGEIARNFESVKFWGKNAKVLVVTEALFATFMSWFFFYQTVFLRALNLDEVSIGYVMTVPLVLQIFLPMLGGYLADRFGRKRVLVLFDSFWIGSMFFWVTAKAFIQIIVAVLLQGLTTTIYGVWETLLVEDTEPQYRASVYSILHMIYIIAEIFTPIAGLFVTIYGIDQGCRYMFLLAISALTAMMVIRWIFLTESGVGKALAFRGVGDTIAHESNYMQILKIITRNRKLFAVFMLISIGNVLNPLVGIYRPLYLSDPEGLNLDKGLISIVPTAASFPSLLVLLFVIPKIKAGHIKKATLYSYILSVIGLLALILAPKGSLALAVFSAILDSSRYIATFPLLRTLLVNLIDEIDPMARAKIMSLSVALPALTSWLSPAIGGYMYSIGPSVPFMAATILLIISIFFIIKYVSS
jgi:MFS family permease